MASFLSSTSRPRLFPFCSSPLVPLLTHLLLVPHISHAAVYVAPDGSNSNAGTREAPVLTLESCADKAISEGSRRCYVRAGKYKPFESAIRNVAGPLSIEADPVDLAAGTRPLFDGTVPLPTSLWTKVSDADKTTFFPQHVAQNMNLWETSVGTGSAFGASIQTHVAASTLSTFNDGILPWQFWYEILETGQTSSVGQNAVRHHIDLARWPDVARGVFSPDGFDKFNEHGNHWRGVGAGTSTGSTDTNTQGTIGDRDTDTNNNAESPTSRTLAGQTGVSFQGCVAVLNVGHWASMAATITAHAAGARTFDYLNRAAESGVPSQNFNDDGKGHYYIEGCVSAMQTGSNEWSYNNPVAPTKLYLNLPLNLHASSGSLSAGERRVVIHAKVVSWSVVLADSIHVALSGIHFFASSAGIFHSLQGSDDVHGVFPTLASGFNNSVSDSIFDFPTFSRRGLGDVEVVRPISGSMQDSPTPVAGMGKYYSLAGTWFILGNDASMQTHAGAAAPFTVHGQGRCNTYSKWENNVFRYMDSAGLLLSNTGGDRVENNLWEWVDYAALGNAVTVQAKRACGFTLYKRNFLNYTGAAKGFQVGDVLLHGAASGPISSRAELNFHIKTGLTQVDGSTLQSQSTAVDGVFFAKNWIADTRRPAIRFGRNEGGVFGRNGTIWKNVVMRAGTPGMNVQGFDQTVAGNLAFLSGAAGGDADDARRRQLKMLDGPGADVLSDERRSTMLIAASGSAPSLEQMGEERTNLDKMLPPPRRRLSASTGALMSVSTDINLLKCWPCSGANAAYSNTNSSVFNNAAGIGSSSAAYQDLEFIETGYLSNNYNDFEAPSMDSPIPVETYLRDFENFDFRPRKHSPLVDTGKLLDSSHHLATLINGAAEIVGSAPDIGAYEHGAESYWIPGPLREKASVPIPGISGVGAASSAVEAMPDADLIFLPARTCSRHKVYFGFAGMDTGSWGPEPLTDAEIVAQGASGINGGSIVVQNPDTTLLEICDLTSEKNICKPPLKLRPGKTYFWRVDGIKDGTGAVVTGDVWQFRVRSVFQKLIQSPTVDAYYYHWNAASQWKGDVKSIILRHNYMSAAQVRHKYGVLRFDLNLQETHPYTSASHSSEAAVNLGCTFTLQNAFLGFSVDKGQDIRDL